MTYTNLKHGGEHMDARLLSAGGKHQPLGSGVHRSHSAARRPRGLRHRHGRAPWATSPTSPAHTCAATARPTTRQMEAYKLGYNFIYDSLEHFQVGASFQEVAEKVPRVPRGVQVPALPHDRPRRRHVRRVALHLLARPVVERLRQRRRGAAGETWSSPWRAWPASAGPRESVKLEEQILITKNGPEVLSHAPFDPRFRQPPPLRPPPTLHMRLAGKVALISGGGPGHRRSHRPTLRRRGRVAGDRRCAAGGGSGT